MRFKKFQFKIILTTVFFSVAASSENLRPIPSYIDVGYKYVGYRGSIYGGDLLRPLLYNTAIKYQSQIGLEERIKSMRGWYYDPRTGQIQKNKPPYGEKSKNCWPGVFFERRDGITDGGKNINVPEVCIKGIIPQKNPVYKYNSKDAEIFFKAYKKLEDEQNFLRTVGALKTLLHLDKNKNLLGEHRSFALFSKFPTATKVVAEFAKLFGRKYLAIISPPAYEYNIGAKRYTKVGLYDFCKICASSQARKNFIDNSDPIWKEFERRYVAIFMCKTISEASAYESSRGWHPCKMEPNSALRNHESYKLLVRKAQKVFEKSPEMFQHDMFTAFREEVKRVAENSPQPAKVLTQNIFDFSGWPFSGRRPGGFCSEDSDCVVLTKNCCGCGRVNAYKGSDKTLFAIDKDSLEVAEAYPKKWTLRRYQYDRRTYCRANFGIEPAIQGSVPGVGTYQTQFEILGIHTCPRKTPIPRPVTFVSPACRKTKKEYDEKTRRSFLKIINDQIERCKTGAYRTSYYVSGSWCEHKNYEERIRNYYNKKSYEKIRKCEFEKGKEERWDKWLAQNKGVICGGFKGKCKSNKCIVVTADTPSDDKDPETGTDDKDPETGTDDKDPETGTDNKDPETGTDDKDKAPIIKTLIYKKFKNPSHFTDGCQAKSDCMVVSGNCCQSGYSGVAFAILKQKDREYWKTRYKECKKADLLKETNKCLKTGKYDVKVACVNSKCVTQPKSKTTGSSGSM